MALLIWQISITTETQTYQILEASFKLHMVYLYKILYTLFSHIKNPNHFKDESQKDMRVMESTGNKTFVKDTWVQNHT